MYYRLQVQRRSEKFFSKDKSLFIIIRLLLLVNVLALPITQRECKS